VRTRTSCGAVGGVVQGIVDAGETCGVLFGGVCLISLFLGKGSDDERRRANLPFAIYDLADVVRAPDQRTLRRKEVRRYPTP
jgi:hypothetical protein